MNIDDIQIDFSQYDGKDRLDIMFETQEELRQAYGIPILSLDVPSDQSIAREFAWNVTEEIGEALEVFTSANPHKMHLLDEVADATSFYLELLLICGLAAGDLTSSHTGDGDKLKNWFDTDKQSYNSDLRRSHSFFIEKLALAINNLKNRKWRKTHVQTNIFTFKKDLWMTFLQYVRIMKYLGVTDQELFENYMKKAEVNKFRLRSNY